MWITLSVLLHLQTQVYFFVIFFNIRYCLYNCLTLYRYNCFLIHQILIPTVLKSQTCYWLFTKKSYACPSYEKNTHTLSVLLIKKYSWNSGAILKIDKGERFWTKSDETFHTIIARFVWNASHLYFLLGQSKEHKPIEEYHCYFLLFQSKGMHLLIQQVVVVVWLRLCLC